MQRQRPQRHLQAQTTAFQALRSSDSWNGCIAGLAYPKQIILQHLLRCRKHTRWFDKLARWLRGPQRRACSHHEVRLYRSLVLSFVYSFLCKKARSYPVTYWNRNELVVLPFYLYCPSYPGQPYNVRSERDMMRWRYACPLTETNP